jgi:hypothetical protein
MQLKLWGREPRLAEEQAFLSELLAAYGVDRKEAPFEDP